MRLQLFVDLVLNTHNHSLVLTDRRLESLETRQRLMWKRCGANGMYPRLALSMALLRAASPTGMATTRTLLTSTRDLQDSTHLHLNNSNSHIVLPPQRRSLPVSMQPPPICRSRPHPPLQTTASATQPALGPQQLPMHIHPVSAMVPPRVTPHHLHPSTSPDHSMSPLQDIRLVRMVLSHLHLHRRMLHPQPTLL